MSVITTERLRLYHKVPELLNHSNDYERLKVLCGKPYTFGNYIDKIWNIRTNSLANVTVHKDNDNNVNIV